MKNIFDSAKIKLTALYLAIIMAVTVSFSIFIFHGVNEATKHALDIQRARVERQLSRVPAQFRGNVVFEDYNTNAILEIREKVLYNLFFVNAFIFIVSGTLGYYLAGRTLEPIEQMLLKQKRFISDAAHELKTPLTAIKADLEVTLRSKNLELSEAKDAMNRTLEEIDSLSAITANLLATSKHELVDSYKKDINIFQLNNLINKVAKKYAAITKEKNIRIIENLADVKIKGDQKDIEQVLNNIIDNAIKYSKDDSSINIVLTQNNKKAEVKIEDEGVGIAEKDLAHIFDPFYRADISRTKSKTEGYGLGLAISKDIIESYGGKIEVTSKPNKGSTFTITLPAI